jgi:hypothetical protein
MAALLSVAIVGPAAAGGRDSAVGGGWRLTDGARVATWALSARSGPSGEDASGRYFFSRHDVGVSLWGEVTCLRVEGNKAVVGGRITRSAGLDNPVGFMVVFIDGGHSAPDQVSGTGILPADAPVSWLDDCPTLDPADFGNGFWRSIQGNVTIVDG